MSNARRKGEQAELAALRMLEASGLQLVARNYRCRSGELDLVMMEGDTLVFAEVRYRTRNGYGSGADSIDRHKQQRVIRAAEHYLAHRPEYDRLCCRFDVVSATRSPDGGRDETLHLEWIRGAFESDV